MRSVLIIFHFIIILILCNENDINWIQIGEEADCEKFLGEVNNDNDRNSIINYCDSTGTAKDSEGGNPICKIIKYEFNPKLGYIVCKCKEDFIGPRCEIDLNKYNDEPSSNKISLVKSLVNSFTKK